jgi:cytochrome c5
MSEKHTEEHATPIKTPRQLIIVVVLAFVVPIGLIVMLTQLVTSGTDAGKSNPAMSSEAVARRLQPVGTVAVDPNPPAPAQIVAVTAGKSAPATAAGGSGKAVYDATCMVCHAAGVAGAPKAADKAAWAPRLKSGMPALYASSMKGKNAMPPKGGNLALSDADVKAAVDYMVGLVK